MLKQERHQAIAGLVQDRSVTTQADLAKALRRLGVMVNQATLSRDLDELGIRKSGGRYVTTAGDQASVAEVDLSPAVHGFVSCGPHLIVLRTAVGQAQPVAVVIDSAGESAIVGTVAGDDTIFVATRNRRTQTVALRRLQKWFGDKHEH